MRKFLQLNFWIILLLLLPATVTYAQNKPISGKVTGADDGLAVIGASVKLKNTTIGQSTDVNGNYTISAPAGGILVFSFMGYVTQEVPVNSQAVINIKLIPDLKGLNEVVVVGYNTVIKRELTGSVSSIKTKDLESVPTA